MNNSYNPLLTLLTKNAAKMQNTKLSIIQQNVKTNPSNFIFLLAIKTVSLWAQRVKVLAAKTDEFSP